MKKLLITFSFCVTILFGEFDKVGTSTAQFLKIGVGARAIAMGGSYVAMADDGYSHYWNPAGIVKIDGISSSFSHTNYLLDISHEYLSLTVPVNNNGALGFSFSALNADEKEVTTVENPDGTGLTYKVMDISAGISYSHQLSDRLCYGITAKYIRLSAYHETANSFAIDIGSILDTGYNGLKIGMALTNFGGNLKYEGRDLIVKADSNNNIEGNYLSDANLQTEAWRLPLMIRIGVAFDLTGPENAFFVNQSNRISISMDAEHPNDASEHVNLGVEYGLMETLFLRVGHRFNYSEDETTFGAGIKLPLGGDHNRISIDYAVLPIGPFGNTSYLSIEFNSLF